MGEAGMQRGKSSDTFCLDDFDIECGVGAKNPSAELLAMVAAKSGDEQDRAIVAALQGMSQWYHFAGFKDPETAENALVEMHDELTRTYDAQRVADLAIREAYAARDKHQSSTWSAFMKAALHGYSVAQYAPGVAVTALELGVDAPDMNVVVAHSLVKLARGAAEDASDLRTWREASLWFALLSLKRGDAQNAARMVRTAREQFEEAGDSREVARCDLMKAAMFLYQGRTSHGDELLAEAVAALGEPGSAREQVFATDTRIVAALAHNDAATAADLSRDAALWFASNGHPELAGNYYLYTATYVDQAAALTFVGNADEAFATIDAPHIPLKRLECRREHARHQLNSGNTADARTELEAILADCEAMGHDVTAADTRVGLAHIAITEKQYEEALDHTSKARSALNIAGDAVSGARCDEIAGASLMELGRSGAARRHMKRAVQGYQSLGMVEEMDRCQELLKSLS